MVRATQADDTTDAQHPLDNLDVIRVNPDDVIAAMRDYHESPDDGRMQVLRVTPPHEGESDAELWTSEQGRSYLDSPAPKHIDPEAFVVGSDLGWDAHNWCSDWEYPDGGTDKHVFDQHGGEDTTWEEWREESLQWWENEVRHALENTDTVTFTWHGSPPNGRVTTDVRVELHD